MMKLSDVLKDIRITIPLTDNLESDLVVYCRKENIDIKEYGNVIAFRFSFGESLIVHTLTDGVAKKIINTRIENLPNELPDKMKKSFLFEAKDKSVLFDDITAIGGFLLKGDLVLLSAYSDGNTIWQHTKSSFDGRKLEDIQFDENPSEEIYGRKVVDRATRKDTFAFVTILSIMLEAERTPILIDGGNKKNRKRNERNKANKAGSWIERRIYIDAKYNKKQEYTDHLTINKDDKMKHEVYIQGFLRNQPYGPKHGLRKWIYVEGFESSRWVNKGDKKIIVGLRHEQL